MPHNEAPRQQYHTFASDVHTSNEHEWGNASAPPRSRLRAPSVGSSERWRRGPDYPPSPVLLTPETRSVSCFTSPVSGRISTRPDSRAWSSKNPPTPSSTYDLTSKGSPSSMNYEGSQPWKVPYKQKTFPPSMASSSRPPPQFMPPSYYAAAAGMLPKDERCTHEEEGRTSEVAQLESDDRSYARPLSTLVPIEYPSVSPSEPPRDDGQQEASHKSRSFMSLRRHSSSRSKKTAAEMHEAKAQDPSPERELSRRASQLGLPDLEKDLLPSLRDTVDRMTQPNQVSVQNMPSWSYLNATTTSSSIASKPSSLLRNPASILKRSPDPSPTDKTYLASRVNPDRYPVYAGSSLGTSPASTAVGSSPEPFLQDLRRRTRPMLPVLNRYKSSPSPAAFDDWRRLDDDDKKITKEKFLSQDRLAKQVPLPQVIVENGSPGVQASKYIHHSQGSDNSSIASLNAAWIEPARAASSRVLTLGNGSQNDQILVNETLGTNKASRIIPPSLKSSKQTKLPTRLKDSSARRVISDDAAARALPHDAVFSQEDSAQKTGSFIMPTNSAHSQTISASTAPVKQRRKLRKRRSLPSAPVVKAVESTDDDRHLPVESTLNDGAKSAIDAADVTRTSSILKAHRSRLAQLSRTVHRVVPPKIKEADSKTVAPKSNKGLPHRDSAERRRSALLDLVAELDQNQPSVPSRYHDNWQLASGSRHSISGVESNCPWTGGEDHPSQPNTNPSDNQSTMGLAVGGPSEDSVEGVLNRQNRSDRDDRRCEDIRALSSSQGQRSSWMQSNPSPLPEPVGAKRLSRHTSSPDIRRHRLSCPPSSRSQPSSPSGQSQNCLSNSAIASDNDPRISSRRNSMISGPSPRNSSVANNADRRDSRMLSLERQRRAFGIPPSASELRHDTSTVTHAESISSLIAFNNNWNEERNEDLGLSLDARKLFNKIGANVRDLSRPNSVVVERSDADGSGRRNSQAFHNVADDTPMLYSSGLGHLMSSCSTEPSIYDDVDCHTHTNDEDRHKDHNIVHPDEPEDLLVLYEDAWRRTLPVDVFASLLGEYGPREMRRQGLIWELYRSERVLVESMHNAMKVYIQPLLSNDRTWISGVPTLLTRLFDWFDDIYQLHSEILAALQGVLESQYPIILQIAESLRPSISRLEVYQPYFVRVDEAMSAIGEMVQDSRNDLGEFFRIQARSQECEGLSLESHLKLPLKRLNRYAEHFQSLLHLTDRNHVDHLATFSLSRLSQMSVRVLHEVKSREGEYDFVKRISGQIQGLPASTQLAQRERRLLAHGYLRRVHIDQGWPLDSHNSSATDRQFNRGGPASSRIHNRPHESDLYAFVFTDLLLFMSTTEDTQHNVSKRVPEDIEQWKLLPDIGVSRLLAVSDQSGRFGYDHLVGLDILPVPVQEVDSGVISAGVSCTYVYLHAPVEYSKDIGANIQSASRPEWQAAFEQCLHFTLRSLSFPTQSGEYLTPSADHQYDTRKSLLTILASGLPLPKSPSVQIQDLQKGADAMQQEREERGWWTLRFHQVIRELYRQGFSV